MQYQLLRPTMVLAFKDNHGAATPIPAGVVVHAVSSAEDDRFMVVAYQNEQFLMFASDLAEQTVLS